MINLKDKTNNVKAISFILIATFAFACMNALAKELSDFPVLQVVFFRSFGTFIFIFPYMLVKKVPLLGTHRKMLALRAIIGTISLAAFFMAVQLMPLGSAVSIRYIGPLISVILAIIFLKEKVMPIQWLGFLIAIIGVFVLKGFDVRISTLGFIMILISAITVGAVFTLVRYLATREHHLTIINYFMVTSILIGLTSVAYWIMPMGIQWYFIIGMGICGLIGQVFMTIAFSLGETNTIAPFKYMELVYALFLGFFIFGEQYSFYASIGMGLIICGMLINLFAKKKKKLII